MSNATAVMGLSDTTLAKLRELRQFNVDSAKGFNECADLVSNDRVKSAFTEIAKTRLENADQLATQIEWNGESEAEDGSYLAAFHRVWIKVREACSSDSVETVLIEAERGEDEIKEAYEDALKEACDSPVCDLIKTQYETVKATHDRVRNLRDAKLS
ncbi:MAG: PA2169 family four-helix-bundle protein [Planctomycetota bacterium]